MSVFNYQKDSDGIVTITMDMTGPVNSMNTEYQAVMQETVDKLQAEDGLMGVILTSAKKTFFAGGNLHDLLSVEKGDKQRFMEIGALVKGQLRTLETLSVPVVATINGAALGGGYEICLACNYRIAWNHKSVQIGLPEVTLGLLPGAGGVVRLTNLLGLEKASPYLLEGKRVAPDKALEIGMIDQIVDSVEALVPAAKQWILDNKGNKEAATNPWDRKHFKIPGGSVNSPRNAQLATMGPTMLAQKTRGLLPAPKEIMDIAFQSTIVDFETAQRIESRGMCYLVTTPEAKNMITTFFFQLNEINGGASRPKNIEPTKVKKLGILGAGMMGQGIAYSSAMAGIEVVLKDMTLETAEKGKAYSDKLLTKRIQRGRMDEVKKQAVLDLIIPTDDNADLSGCDLIIEAVFENLSLKHTINESTESYLAENGVWGSNTSTLPIAELSKSSKKPENFIGIHFFSPVDKMPLVEIICGEQTSDETLAKAYDFVKQIRKTPIVVNDSLGFFTSRTFGTYLDEGLRLLDEGVHPVKIDNLGKGIGMPVGPLAIQDETSLELARKARETWGEMGVLDQLGSDSKVIERMINVMIGEHGRGGRHHGGGFYEYHADGSKEIWPPLFDIFYKENTQIDDSDIRDRLMFRPVIEALKCLQENVLRSVADGNIGSIMGIGAPVHTGGYIQFVNTYGLQNFTDRCNELSEIYGERFNAPEIVAQKLAAGELFK